MGTWSKAVPWLLCALLAACGSKEPEARRYPLTGQVLAVRPETSEVLVKHEDIPNFMPAMTMPYKVKEGALLKQAAPGDLIKATLVVADTDAWLEAIEKTGTAPLPDNPPSIPAASGVHPLEPGDAAPDTVLTDQDGRPAKLSDWRGQAIAITFIYTRCPLPQFCPMLDRRFAEVQGLVAGDASLASKVRLLSVSFDPDTDTPAMLKAHAAKLKADPAMWRFATAPRDQVDRFAAEFGVNVVREADRTVTHNMKTAVIGPDGRVTALLDGSEWTASALVNDLRAALGGS